MSAVPPRARRPRPRRGSLERPVSARTYRGTWLLVALPLLVAAFTVSRPAPLAAPDLPPAFDIQSAYDLTKQLATEYPNRAPATTGAEGAVRWLLDQLRPYGFQPRVDRFEADVAGRGRLRFRNVIATIPGRSEATIVVVAHRDNSGISPGADDNASGTAALIELARSYANPAGSSSTPSSARRVSPAHTIVFLSTDGGSLGGLGALHFARDRQLARRVVAVVNLDSIAGGGAPRLEFGGDRPRSASPTLVATAAARIADERATARHPGALRQLIDLGFPFSFYEQAPFDGRGISAVTLTSNGDRPHTAENDVTGQLHRGRLGQMGRAAQQLLASLDEGLELTQGTATYVYFGSRIVRGWALELVLIAALLPFLAASVDMFALCRRRRIPLAPAFRSYRSRLGFWLWLLVVFELLRGVGIWPHGEPVPSPLQGGAGTNWSFGALLALVLLALVGWLVSRDRLLPRREVTSDEELAGYATALLVLAVIGLLIVAVNAYALVFFLPAAHAWLWLAQLRGRPLPLVAAYAAGLIGPALLLGSFALRMHLGFDAPWYLSVLAASGYVPFAVLVIAALFGASGAQLAALSVKRYAPYPDVRERPPLGPLRRILRSLVLASRARRRRLRVVERDGALEG
jgi:hypothetical protein